MRMKMVLKKMKKVKKELGKRGGVRKVKMIKIIIK